MEMHTRALAEGEKAWHLTPHPRDFENEKRRNYTKTLILTYLRI
jgi:hypothetical protein